MFAVSPNEWIERVRYPIFCEKAVEVSETYRSYKIGSMGEAFSLNTLAGDP